MVLQSGKWRKARREIEHFLTQRRRDAEEDEENATQSFFSASLRLCVKSSFAI